MFKKRFCEACLYHLGRPKSPTPSADHSEDQIFYNQLSHTNQLPSIIRNQHSSINQISFTENHPLTTNQSSSSTNQFSSATDQNNHIFSSSSGHHISKSFHLKHTRVRDNNQENGITKILYFNARSIRNKLTDLDAILKTNEYKLIFVTETWLQSTDLSSTIIDTQNFNIIRNDRKSHGGGVAAICSATTAKKIVTHYIDPKDTIGFELISFDLYISSRKHLCFICVYLPPHSSADVDTTKRMIKILKRFVAKKDVYIIGDFNFGKYNWDSSTLPTGNKPLKHFLLFLQEHKLSQIVTSPTRGSNILDLIIVKNLETVFNTEVQEPFTESSDHNKLVLSLNTKIRKEEPRSRIRKRNFYRADFSKINQFLSTVNWESLLTSSDSIENMYKSFLDIIHRSIDLYVPLYRTSSKPTLPKRIRNLLKEKQALYKKSKFNNKFKKAYTDHAKLYKAAIKDHRKQAEERVITSRNKKVLFSHMKRQLRTTHHMPPLMEPSGNISLDSLGKANLLNGTFAKVFLKEDTTSSSLHIPIHAENTHIPPNIFTRITHADIMDAILKMKTSVSRTPDSIPSLYIKKTSQQLLIPLFILFNHSVRTSQIPSLWKRAIIVPIFKKGKSSDPNNYRPISLTCVLCRILERIIHKYMLEHLMKNKLISPSQHGFVSKRSTQTQQLKFLDTLTRMHDDKIQTDIIYLDFSKSFDTVSHSKLLKVLSHVKLNKRIVSWIQNYLSSRTQTTLVDDRFSDMLPITSGVPQGSVLGPLLFVLYIDDLIRLIDINCKDTMVLAYADDIKLVSNNSQDLQLALDLVDSWVSTWQLRLNANKSEHLTIKEKSPIILTINNQPIPKVNNVRDLGIKISSNLEWKPYIDQLRAKANTLGYSILRTFSSNNCWLLLNLYKIYVRPLVEYNTCSWSPSAKGEIKAIESVQRKFTRRLCQKTNIRFTSYEDRLHKLNLESLQVRRIKNDLIFLFKILNNYVDINFSDLFQNAERRTHNLRRPSHYISRQKLAHYEIRNNFFSYRVIKYWNSLPENLVASETLESFKYKMKKYNLKVLDKC